MEKVMYKTVKLDHTTLGGTRLFCAENSISSEENVERILLTQSKNVIMSSKCLVRDKITSTTKQFDNYNNYKIQNKQ